ACLVTAYATNSQHVNDAIVSEAWADYSRLVGSLPAPPAITLPPPRPIPYAATTTPPEPATDPAAGTPPTPLYEAPRAPAQASAAVPNRSTMADRVPEPEPDDGVPASAPWTFTTRQLATVIVVVLLALATNQFLFRGSLSERDRVAPPTKIFGVEPGVE